MRATLLFSVLIGGSASADLSATRVTSDLVSPLFATAPAADARLFVVERAGRIRIIEQAALLPDPFLDISDQVRVDGERGLLGLAFSPDYRSSGAFYVYYIDLSGRSQISRFFASANPDSAAALEEPILTLDQPADNHNGGTIAFGADGYLYFAPGDGGDSNDPAERSQDPEQLLGKMLRLDVGPVFAPQSTPVAGTGYAIPADNPFVDDQAVRSEIWSFGLRNPYRFSFDRATGDLWIADVGQGRREEIDFEPAGDPGGRNWGWDVMEGSLCNDTDPAPSPDCNDDSLSPPFFEYAHNSGNCSITGGFVARAGPAEWSGRYVYGDFCTGRIWALDRDSAETTEWTASLGDAGGRGFQLVGFGEDALGRLYIVLSGGELFRVETLAQCNDGQDNDADGSTDFPEDPGCRVPTGPSEDPACSDGVDNDRDGLIDVAEDPGCLVASSVRENPPCDDGIDNDRDGQVDLSDPECQGNSWARETVEVCGLGFEAIPFLSIVFAVRRMRTRQLAKASVARASGE